MSKTKILKGQRLLFLIYWYCAYKPSKLRIEQKKKNFINIVYWLEKTKSTKRITY